MSTTVMDDPVVAALEQARDDTRTIYERMVAILGELPAIGKDSLNTQQNFHFRSHDSVLNALNPLLAKHGVFVVPQVLERVPGERTTRSGSTMYEVNLHVQYTFYGSRGDLIVASAWGEGTDSGDKSTNKAMTMAFKNALAQAFAVSTEDTIDADSGSPEETTRGGGQQAAPAPAQPSVKDALDRLTLYVEDAVPWVKESILALHPEITDFASYGDLPPAIKDETTARLWKVVATLDKAKADGVVSVTDLKPDSEGMQALAAAVRAAFSEAWGVDVTGPEPFNGPVPF